MSTVTTWKPAHGLPAVVETYAASTSVGIETGWTVKVGDDSLEDFQTKEAADAYAAAYNSQLHADATALYTYTVYMNDGSEYYQVPAPTAVYAMLAAEGIARYNARDHHAIDAVRNP